MTFLLGYYYFFFNVSFIFKSARVIEPRTIVIPNNPILIESVSIFKFG